MNNSPKISIIVPVYNVEKYLHRCVDSILSQTFTDFELLLIDDGSKDKSGAICDEYAGHDKRIRVFHKANGGASSARNVGLDNAKGEYICFCDADDWVDSSWLQLFVGKFPKDLIVQGFYYKMDDASNWNKCRMKSTSMDVVEALDYLYGISNMGYLWCRCFKKTIITDNHIRFNNNFAVREDYDFILSYNTHISKMTLLDNYTYYYIMPDFLGRKYSKVKNISDMDCIISVYDKLNFILKGNLDKKYVFDEVVRMQSDLFKDLFRNKAKISLYLDKYEKIKRQSGYVPSTAKERIKNFCLCCLKQISNF